MELVLALDLKDGLVVHGERGDRANYRPLTWGASPVADPVGFINSIRPASVYIADLDRIAGREGHDKTIALCNELVRHCYADRGCRGPEDMLDLPHLENVIGTETCGGNYSRYGPGYLSIDMKEGRVIPSMEDPVRFISSISPSWFDGCIILDISNVGTSSGLSWETLIDLRSAYEGRLLWGGGVSSMADLELLDTIGFEGAIIATAVHKKKIPLDMVRRGTFC